MSGFNGLSFFRLGLNLHHKKKTRKKWNKVNQLNLAAARSEKSESSFSPRNQITRAPAATIQSVAFWQWFDFSNLCFFFFFFFFKRCFSFYFSAREHTWLYHSTPSVCVWVYQTRFSLSAQRAALQGLSDSLLLICSIGFNWPSTRYFLIWLCFCVQELQHPSNSIIHPPTHVSFLHLLCCFSQFVINKETSRCVAEAAHLFKRLVEPCINMNRVLRRIKSALT